jgi:carbamoyl-phosphate synthase large subunit
MQATIMTDPGTADRTYIGPMTPELVEQILDKVSCQAPAWIKFCVQVGCAMHQVCAFAQSTDCTASICGSLNLACTALQERPEAILPTMGGQTGLNLAKALAEVSFTGCCPHINPVLSCALSLSLTSRPLEPHSDPCFALLQQGILEKYNVELIGAKLPSIDKAEDRELFKQASTLSWHSLRKP